MSERKIVRTAVQLWFEDEIERIMDVLGTSELVNKAVNEEIAGQFPDGVPVGSEDAISCICTLVVWQRILNAVLA